MDLHGTFTSLFENNSEQILIRGCGYSTIIVLEIIFVMFAFISVDAFSSKVVRGKVISGPVQVNDYSPHNFLGRFLAKQVYTFRITKTYKGAPAIKRTGSLQVFGSRKRSYTTKIYTPSRTNSCRVSLAVGRVYVIAGYIGRKRLSISGCNFLKEWKRMTKKQRSGFARKYSQSCECVHHKCYEDCGKEPQPMACDFDISWSPANECRDKYQYCQLNTNGRSCSWTKNSLYRKCINRIP